MRTPTRLNACVVLLSLLPALAPGGAAAFISTFGARVAPVSATVFEGVSRGVGGGPEYWCGASEYARRALGADWRTVIYIARGRGPSGTTGRRSAVHFTLDPVAAGINPTGPSRNHNGLKTGESMTVQQGNLFCIPSPNQF